MSCRRSFGSLLVGCLLFFGRLDAADQSAVPASSSPNRDVALKVYRTTPVLYPQSLSHSGFTRGEAQILIAIDAKGNAVDTLIAAYTHERFAEAALEAIRKWRFEAPLVHGETADAVVDIQVRFEMNKVLVVERIGVPTFQPSDAPDGFAYKPQGLRVLDAIPTPVHVVQPIYPKEWSTQGMHGKVMVDFYIDETGTVRMPSVLQSPEYPLLAASAITAVREWHFTPPLRQGHPVLAHCQQVFTFEVDQVEGKE